MQDLQKQVKEYRIKHGLTLQEMADKCGVALQTIFNIENGRGKPTCKTIAKVNKVVGERNEEN